ncbi:MAG: MOSC domain-containing protein [Pseudomonadota bacterium]
MSFTGSILHLHRTAKGGDPMEPLTEMQLIVGRGIKGDRYLLETGTYSHLPEPGRQITLFEVETLDALARDHDISLAPHEHRRNVTVEGVPVNHLVGRRFRVGETVLEGTRLSTPCKHIEEVTGKTISRWLIHRCGLNCIIVEGGAIRPGDAIRPLD